MKKIIVSFSDGTRDQVEAGIAASSMEKRFGALKSPLAAVLVNNQLCSLHSRLELNCRLEAVCVADPLGAPVYRRSLCFLLAIASREIFPDRRLVVGHSLGNGYYHTFADEEPVTLDDAEKLQARMRAIVAEGQDIRQSLISYQDALSHFEKSGQEDTLLLLRQMNDAAIQVNSCRGFMDLFVSPLVKSAAVLRWFELMPYGKGFILRYPAHGRHDAIEPFVDDPLLFSVYSEYKRWGRILGLGSVGSLNALSRSAEIRSMIQVAEALQNKKIAEIADKVAAQADRLRAVLVAGPSSSGKTTFSKKISIQLTVMGLKPLPISLDDYFLDREDTPKDENGQYDFECLEALDIDYLNDQLVRLMAGERVELPVYDFKTGTRKASGKFVQLTGREVLILEGIHGLNDKLTYRIPRERKFKVYVSALTQLNLDDHNRISTTDNRLVRRMVRDFQFRGHSAQETLKMWPSVQRGEKKHIFPFQNSADAAFNSALDYELSILRIFAEPLLKRVKPCDREYAEASRILSFLDYFSPLSPHYVPRDSILREFIGESEFKY